VQFLKSFLESWAAVTGEMGMATAINPQTAESLTA
jgi:hypothetical protein